MAAMLVNRLGKMSNTYRGPSIDPSYQVSVHLAKQFPRRREMRKVNRRQVMTKAHMAFHPGELNNGCPLFSAKVHRDITCEPYISNDLLSY